MSTPKKKSAAEIKAELADVQQNINILRGRRVEIDSLAKHGDHKIRAYRAEIARLEASIAHVEEVKRNAPSRLEAIDASLSRLETKLKRLENHSKIEELERLLREAGVATTPRTLERVG